ncbi:MAG: M48 family metalloprotease [Bryobacteraceae bacterium]
MPRPSLLLPVLAVTVFCAGPALAQPPATDASIQFRKEIALGQQLAHEVERQDGTVADPAIVDYLDGIANRLAGATGVKPFQIRVTRGLNRYAYLMPHGVLYISGPLLERVESEAELAGLLAHQLAHSRAPLAAAPGSAGTPLFLWPKCVLASQVVSLKWAEDHRDSERLATETAIQTLRAAGYDPTAVLDLLSKLAYENPIWGKAINSDDLLDLRVKLDADIAPKAGYVLDSSAFAFERIKLGQALKEPLAPRPRFAVAPPAP